MTGAQKRAQANGRIMCDLSVCDLRSTIMSSVELNQHNLNDLIGTHLFAQTKFSVLVLTYFTQIHYDDSLLVQCDRKKIPFSIASLAGPTFSQVYFRRTKLLEINDIHNRNRGAVRQFECDHNKICRVRYRSLNELIRWVNGYIELLFSSFTCLDYRLLFCLPRKISG